MFRRISVHILLNMYTFTLCIQKFGMFFFLTIQFGNIVIFLIIVIIY